MKRDRDWFVLWIAVGAMLALVIAAITACVTA